MSCNKGRYCSDIVYDDLCCELAVPGREREASRASSRPANIFTSCQACVQQSAHHVGYPKSIEEDTDRREGKGRRCCLGDGIECRTLAI